jgi:hypothetical protein
MEGMQNNQKGSAVAVSLVLLTAITLISISSMQRSGLQTKIVSNLQHHETLFQTTQNEQEHWWKELQTSDSRGILISQAKAEFVLDLANEKTYSPTALNDNTGFNNSILPIDQSSSLLFIPPVAGELALSEGSELNQVIPLNLQLSSSSNIRQRNLRANQQMGISVSALNNTKHSL